MGKDGGALSPLELRRATQQEGERLSLKQQRDRFYAQRQLARFKRGTLTKGLEEEIPF